MNRIEEIGKYETCQKCGELLCQFCGYCKNCGTCLCEENFVDSKDLF